MLYVTGMASFQQCKKMYALWGDSLCPALRIPARFVYESSDKTAVGFVKGKYFYTKTFALNLFLFR
jgi:hypothetical protein